MSSIAGLDDALSEDRGVVNLIQVQELPEYASALRQRMIEDMSSRQLSAGTQGPHQQLQTIGRVPEAVLDTATFGDIRLFQLHLAETTVSVCNRNRIMTGLRFLFRVTLRRLGFRRNLSHP